MFMTPIPVRALAGVLIVAMAAPGCAMSARPRLARAEAGPSVERQLADRTVLAEYVQKLRPGSTVRVERADGRTVRGTLMKATDQLLIVQPRTRLPEPPVEIPLADVLAVTPDTGNGSSIGKAIAVGAAAGAGAALAFFFIMVSMFD
jgi:hypothetical protein